MAKREVNEDCGSGPSALAAARRVADATNILALTGNDVDAVLARLTELRSVFEAVFEAIDSPAFLLDAEGTMTYANSAGFAMAEADPSVAWALRESLVALVEGSRFVVTRIPAQDCAPLYLVVERERSGPLAGSRVAVAARSWKLTSRQMQVLTRLVDGWTNARIASELGIAERTIEDHVRVLFQKARVSSRSELVAKVLRR